MRIWSLHPKYLDAKGLVALWRETLLAQKVLQGKTKGYKNHPQLERFKRQVDPIAAIATYLEVISQEAAQRGYAFDASKIDSRRMRGRIQVTHGQLVYEWEHLRDKLSKRDSQKLAAIQNILAPEPHPLFTMTDGDVEAWERI